MKGRISVFAIFLQCFLPSSDALDTHKVLDTHGFSFARQAPRPPKLPRSPGIASPWAGTRSRIPNPTPLSPMLLPQRWAGLQYADASPPVDAHGQWIVSPADCIPGISHPISIYGLVATAPTGCVDRCVGATGFSPSPTSNQSICALMRSH